MRANWISQLGAYLSILVLVAACGDPDDSNGQATNNDDGDSETQQFTYTSLNPPAPGNQRVHIAEVDGSDTQVSAADSTSVRDKHSRWSPDGQSIAFLRSDSSGTDVWMVGADGENERKLTDFQAESCRRVTRDHWRSDSGALMFSCGDENTSQVGYVTPQGEVTLFSTGDSLEYYRAVFTPDDEVLATAKDTSDNTWSLRRFPADQAASGGTTVASFTEDRSLFGLRLSPDASKVAFLRDDDQQSIGGALYVVDLEDEDPSVQPLLTDEDGEPTYEHVARAWHPNGEQLLVATGGYGEGAAELSLVNVSDASDATVLVEPSDLNHGTISTADISPDGQLVVYDDMNDTGDGNWSSGSIYVVGSDGENRRLQSNLSVPDRASNPSFAPSN